jgi:hypothetical protein
VFGSVGSTGSAGASGFPRGTGLHLGRNSIGVFELTGSRAAPLPPTDEAGFMLSNRNFRW